MSIRMNENRINEKKMFCCSMSIIVIYPLHDACTKGEIYFKIPNNHRDLLNWL